jgi:hypothetical protein
MQEQVQQAGAGVLLSCSCTCLLHLLLHSAPAYFTCSFQRYRGLTLYGPAHTFPPRG